MNFYNKCKILKHISQLLYNMKFITTILKKILPVELPKHVGRWNIDYCNIKTNTKIDLSNEDHCGPCGQYALTKLKSKNKDNDNDKAIILLNEKSK